MKSLFRSGFLTLLLLAAAVPALAGPITFDTALPVARGEGIFRAQLQYLTASDNGPGNLDLEAWALPVVGVYGLTEKWTLLAIIPYLDKELEVNTPLGRRTREVSGLGDSLFLARYTAFSRDWPGRTFRLAPFAGLKAPTGEDDERDGLGRLPQPLQLGSGSWDPFFGLVTSLQTLQRQFDAALSYRFNTEADDFEFGGVARLDFSWQERVWPRELGQGVPAFVYAVLEGNLIWQDHNEIDRRDDPDSGGTTLFVAPGLQYVTKRTVLEAAVQIPVIQDLNGDALETDYVAILSFRVNF